MLYSFVGYGWTLTARLSGDVVLRVVSKVTIVILTSKSLVITTKVVFLLLLAKCPDP